MFTIPVFGVWPDVATGVYMIVFVMMAVGLNIVVGYAGLLDLGYVAFYATGAYTAAWFASLQFPHAHLALRRGRHRPAPAGHPRLDLARCCCSPGIITALFGIIIGLPTLRLRGDYLAIVTLGFGEIISADRAQQRQLLRHRLQPDERAERDHADRLARLRQHLSHWTGRLPAGELPAVLQRDVSRPPDPVDRRLLLDRDRAAVFTVFCSLRLRDSRLGRAWIAIREDETAAAAMGIPLMRTKTWAYASGAFFGGVAGAYLRRLQERDVPGRLLLQHLGLHPLHGHPRRHGQHLGRDRRRRVPRLPEPGGPREHRRLDQRERPHRQPPPEPRRAALRVRHLRR